MQNDEKAELNCEKHTNNNCFLYKIIQIYMALCGWPFFSEKWDEKVIKLNGSYIVKKKTGTANEKKLMCENVDKF